MLMNAQNSLLAMEGFDPMAMMPMPLGEGDPQFAHMMQPVLQSDHHSDYDDLYNSGCVYRNVCLRASAFLSSYRSLLTRQ